MNTNRRGKAIACSLTTMISPLKAGALGAALVATAACAGRPVLDTG